MGWLKNISSICYYTATYPMFRKWLFGRPDREGFPYYDDNIHRSCATTDDFQVEMRRDAAVILNIHGMNLVSG